MTRDRVESVLASIGPRDSLADALLSRGLLEPEQRALIVGEQVRDILWSTFSWREGSYRMLASALARRPAVTLSFQVASLILEGVRRTSVLVELRRDLPRDLALARTPQPPFDARRLELEKGEEAMLSHADGTKTVTDLVILSGLSERSALSFLQACRDLCLLDEVSRVLSGTRRMGFL